MAFVTKNRPCPICGGYDWCTWYSHVDSSETFRCFRKEGLSGQDTFHNGIHYVFRGIKSDQLGEYGLYQDEVTYNQFHQKHANTERKASKRKEIVYDVTPVASADYLNSVYSYFLSLLVLEFKDLKILQDEWNAGIEPTLTKKILGKYPIKSIPPTDSARFASGIRIQNMSRKRIMEKMVFRFGNDGLVGVPGFYQRERDDVWQMSSLSGIVYPCYDSCGNIIRLRVCDATPMVKLPLKNSAGEVVVNDSGSTVYGGHYSYNYDGEWVFKNYESNEETIVYSIQKQISKVEFCKKGYPVGKVEGKYKNWSSYSEKKEETEEQITIVNRLKNGTQSGSSISLYCKDGDDFTTVYIVEGEKKAIVLNMLLNCPVISVPGVGTWSKVFEPEAQTGISMMDMLRKRGVVNWIIAYDADKESNISVLNAEQNAAKAFLDEGCNIYITFWNINFGKGIDDIIIPGNRPNYRKIT